MRQIIRTVGLAAMGAVFFAASAHAVEKGTSPISGGAENYLAGAAPPPGLYWLAYGLSYRATRFNDKDGHQVLPGNLGVRIDALVGRMHYATAEQWLGGQLVWDVLVPYAQADLVMSGTSQQKSGIGDIELGPGVAYHHSAHLHSAVALHVQLPTGAYDSSSSLNLGHHYISLLPIYTVSYVNPTGWNGDIKVTTSFNSTNHATHYKSGSEVVVDYALGYAVAPKWVVGLGGFARQQFTDDKGPAASADGNRVRAFAIGPSLMFNSGSGFFITAKYQYESKVQNTWQGQSLWLKATVPF